jgi:hypothetical protein
MQDHCLSHECLSELFDHSVGSTVTAAEKEAADVNARSPVALMRRNPGMRMN